MNFDEQLQGIVRSVDGAQAAVLMGFDGIAVAEYRSEKAPPSLQDLAIEYSRILAESAKIAQANELGVLAELALSLDRHKLILRVINANYFVLLWLAPEANLGKGRYILRRAQPALQAEL